MTIGLYTLIHIVGSVLLIPGQLFVILGGFIAGYYFKGEFYGYIVASIVIFHINLIAGFVAFLNSKMCFKAIVRY